MLSEISATTTATTTAPQVQTEPGKEIVLYGHNFQAPLENNKTIYGPLTGEVQGMLQSIIDNTNKSITKMPPSPTAVQKLIKLLPGAGNALGWAWGQTKGANYCNEAVRYLLPLFVNVPQETGFFSSVAKTGFEVAVTGAQLAITPLAAPWVTLLCQKGAELSVDLLISIGTSLAGEENSQPAELASIDQLIKYDAENKVFRAYTGKALTPENIQNLAALVIKHQFVNDLKNGDGDQIKAKVDKFCDAIIAEVPLSEKEKKKLEKKRNHLSGNLPGEFYGDQQAVGKSITYLCQLAARIDNSAIYFRNQRNFEISKIFERMTSFLEIPEATQEQKYRFEASTGTLGLSGDYALTRWWYGDTSSATQAKLEASLESVDNDLAALETLFANMDDSTEAEKAVIGAEIEKLSALSDSFMEKIQASRKGGNLLEVAEKIHTAFKTKLPALNLIA